MSSNQIIDRLSTLFNAEECRVLVQALNQDNLVWKTFKNEENLDGFINYAQSIFDSWTPGFLSVYLIDPDFHKSSNLLNKEQYLTEGIRSRAHQAYENIKRTRLIPESLEQAGLIALFIREHYLEQEDWKGVSKKLIFRNADAPDQMYFNLFKTTFACLPSLVPQFSELANQLIKESEISIRSEFIALIVHALLSSPTSNPGLLERFKNIFVSNELDVQIDCLFHLDQFGYHALSQSLAAIFLTEQNNIAEYSKAVNFFESSEKKIFLSQYYKYIHTLEKFSELYEYAGKIDEASTLMKLTTQALEQSQSRIYHRLAVSSKESNTANDYWQKALNVGQLSDDLRIDYTDYLLSIGEAEKAKEFISDLPDPIQEEFLTLHHQQIDPGETVKIAIPPNLHSIQHEEDYQNGLKLIEKQLEKRPNDEDYLSKAIDYHQKLGQLQNAIDRAILLRAINPDNIENKTKLAKLYAATKQYQKAFELLQSLIDNSTAPSREELLEYATIAIEAGYPEIAIPICENFLEKNKLDGESLVILGSAYVESGDKTTAIEFIEKAAAISPENPASWLALANIWERLGETENAIGTLEKGITALPENLELLLALGNSFLKSNRPSESLPVLIKCYQLKPDDVNISVALGNAHYAIGRIEEAWQVIERLHNQFLSIPSLGQISGKILSSLGQHDKAIPLLKYAYETIKTQDSLVDLINELLDYANSKERSQEEIVKAENEILALLPILEESVNNDQLAFTLKISIAEVKTFLQMHEEAYQEYLKLLDLPESRSPQNYQRIQYGIGKNAHKLKYSEISLAALQEAIISDPNNLEAHYLLSEAFLQSGLIEESFKSATTALNASPEDVNNRLWYSEFMLRNGQPQKSIDALQEGIKLSSSKRELFLTLAKTYLSINDKQNAEKVLSTMLSNNVVSTKEMISASKIFFNINSKDKASSILERAVEEGDIPDFETLNDLAISLLDIDQAEKALHLIESNPTLSSKDFRYEILKSDILACLGKYQDAYLTLGPVLKKIEYLPNALDKYNKTVDHFDKSYNYSTSGVFARCAQLEFLIGDLLPAKKHIGQASIYSPGVIEYEALSSEIAFSLYLAPKIVDAIKAVESKIPEFSEIDRSQFNSMVNKASIMMLLTGESSSARNFYDNYLLEQETTPESLALKAILAEVYPEFGNTQDIFLSVENTYEKYQTENDLRNVPISKFMERIWITFAAALAAWSSKKWDTAYDLFQKTVDLNIINPIVNFSFARFLLDYAQEVTNCRVLKITSHVPKQDTESPSFYLYFNEQLSLAGRYLDRNLIDHLQLKGLVIFSENRYKDTELEKLIKDAKDSIHLLPYISDNKTVKSIVKAFSDNVGVAFQYALLLCTTDPNQSFQIAQKLIEKDPNSPVLYALKSFASQDDSELAIEAIEIALNIWPDEPEWHAFAAQLYREKELYEDAAKHLEQSIAIDPDRAHYWQALGEIKLEEKDLLAAKSYFAKASEIFPDNPKTLVALSRINSRMGNLLAAIKSLQIAEQNDSSNVTYSEDIANLYFSHNEIDKAIEKANTILLHHPESIKAKVILIKSYLKNHLLDKAKSELTSSLSLHPNSIDLQIAQIEILRVERGLSTALAATIELATQNQENTQVLLLLASQLIEAGRQDQAMETLHHSLEVEPEQANVYLLLGRINRKNGNLDQAVAHLSKAVLLDPSLSDAYLELGKTYQERREHSKAIQIYKSALDIIQNNADLYHQAGLVYKESRDFRNAEVMLRQAAALKPDDVAIRRQLASVVTLNLVHNIQEASRR